MKKKTTIINIAIIVLVCILGVSGYNLFKDLNDARESSKQVEELEEIINQTPVDETEYITPYDKYESVYRMNNDFVGWIKIDGTELDYPVMQTKDNPEYYLRKNFDKSYNYHGTPFIDYKCTLGESDNIIIYSHNMDDGSMFSAVEDYMSKAFMEEHRYITFDSMDEFATYEVICVFKVDIRTTDFDFVSAVDFETEEDFNEFISTAKAHAPYESGVSATFGDKLLTLATCEYTLEDGRCVVIAKQISSADKMAVE